MIRSAKTVLRFTAAKAMTLDAAGLQKSRVIISRFRRRTLAQQAGGNSVAKLWSMCRICGYADHLLGGWERTATS